MRLELAIEYEILYSCKKKVIKRLKDKSDNFNFFFTTDTGSHKVFLSRTLLDQVYATIHEIHGDNLKLVRTFLFQIVDGEIHIVRTRASSL